MKKIFKNMDYVLLISVILMCVIGLFAILSASSVKGALENDTPYYFFKRQLIILGFSYFVGMVLLCIKNKHLNALSPLIMLGGIGLLGLVLIIGGITNGTQGWFYIGSFGVQPSEFIKLFTVLYLGWILSKYEKRDINFKRFLWIVLPAVLSAFLIYLEGDTGTAILYSLICLITFSLSPLKKNWLTMAGGIVISVVAIVFASLLIFDVKLFDEDDYRFARFNTKAPCSRYLEEGTGYQVCNGFIAINNGGLKGLGIGNSTQKYLYLPEAQTDFIFPIIVEEIGVLLSIGIILLYLLILYRIYKISKDACNIRDKVVAFGVFVYMSLHFIINLGGVLSLIPLTGVPLLLLSYGGSSCLTAISGIFIVERIAAESKIQRKIDKIKNI